MKQKIIKYELFVTVPVEWKLEPIAQRINAGVEETLKPIHTELYLIKEGEEQEII